MQRLLWMVGVIGLWLVIGITTQADPPKNQGDNQNNNRGNNQGGLFGQLKQLRNNQGNNQNNNQDNNQNKQNNQNNNQGNNQNNSQSNKQDKKQENKQDKNQDKPAPVDPAAVKASAGLTGGGLVGKLIENKIGIGNKLGKKTDNKTVKDAEAAKAAAEKAYVDAQNQASVARGQFGGAQGAATAAAQEEAVANAKYDESKIQYENAKKAAAAVYSPQNNAAVEESIEKMKVAQYAAHDAYDKNRGAAAKLETAYSSNANAATAVTTATAARDNADKALGAAKSAERQAGSDVTGAVLQTVLHSGGYHPPGSGNNSGQLQPNIIVYPVERTSAAGVEAAAPLVVAPGAATPIEIAEPAAGLVESPGAVGLTASINGAGNGTTPQEQRYLQIRNGTGKPVTIWVQYYSKTDQGQWAWFPADPGVSSKAIAYELDAGETLGHEGGKMSASRIRFWVKSEGGEWAEYKNQDAWLVPEVDKQGRHVYLAKEMEVFPLQLAP